MNDARLFSSLVFCTLIAMTGAGCSRDLPRLSVAQTEAVNHNARGIKAEARGNHELALEELGESLRINASLDNAEGSIVALVNIARVNRRMGNTVAAREAANRALELVTPQSAVFAQVAFEKASVDLQANNLQGAQEWSKKAVSSAPDSGKGAAINLLARVLHRERQFDAAREQAENALSLSRSHGQREEEANALRLLGAVHRETNRTVEALDAFGKALDLDKNLGKSRKIAADLRGIADTHAAMGREREAVSFYRRAQNVSLNGGDMAAAAEDLLRMAQLHEKLGEKERSLQLLKEREALLNQETKR